MDSFVISGVRKIVRQGDKIWPAEGTTGPCSRAAGGHEARRDSFSPANTICFLNEVENKPGDEPHGFAAVGGLGRKVVGYIFR